jgi:adenylate cyclase
MPKVSLYHAVGDKANTISVTEFPFVFGREPDCDFVLSEKSVSRTHCQLVLQNDLVFLVDFGSRNGTFVNETIVSAPVQLSHGDTIKICGTEITVIITQ